MSGVIKKLYHPTDGGTVTTLPDPSLQELFPIVSTTGVIAPEGAFHANDNLDQILRWLDANKISGTGLKTLTINGVEQSLIGSETIVINTGGGGGGGDSNFFELDASGNLHVKNDRGLYTGSFISAGGVGSGGGQGGDGNATSIMGYPIYVDPEVGGIYNYSMLIFDSTGATSKWIPVHPYRAIDIKKANSTIINVLSADSFSALFLKEGTGITLEKGNDNSIVISAQGGGGSLPTAGAGLQYGTGVSASTLSVKYGSGLGINGSGQLYCSLDLSNYVDKTSTQNDITGFKTFQSGIGIGNNSKTITLVNGEIVINGNVKVNGNFYATGAVTAGA